MALRFSVLNLAHRLSKSKSCLFVVVTCLWPEKLKSSSCMGNVVEESWRWLSAFPSMADSVTFFSSSCKSQTIPCITITSHYISFCVRTGKFSNFRHLLSFRLAHFLLPERQTICWKVWRQLSCSYGCSVDSLCSSGLSWYHFHSFVEYKGFWESNFGQRGIFKTTKK